jgi:hydroxyacylglutathione hydrolase
MEKGFFMSSVMIEQIAVLNDNYVYLIFDPKTQSCACVDPAVAAPVVERLEEKGWRLSHIINTHHHNDHVGANLELKEKYGCQIVGNLNDAARIPGIDQKVSEGDVVEIGAIEAHVIEVPGHTSGHIAYYIEGAKALFCGDTLFALGCGRLFEGTAAQMWDSLSKFQALPDDVMAYCAHEYTQANANFAITIDPENAALKSRIADIESLRAANKPTVPSSIGLEKATNPFLRPEETGVQKTLGMVGQDTVAVFAEIRHRKDNF